MASAGRPRGFGLNPPTGSGRVGGRYNLGAASGCVISVRRFGFCHCGVMFI